jgi:hypothetical protein
MSTTPSAQELAAAYAARAASRDALDFYIAANDMEST